MTPWDWVWMPAAWIGFGLAVYNLVTDEHRKREHHWAQQARLKWDGYAPPWWMCWTYWIGIERWFFGHKMHRDHQAGRTTP